MNAIATNQKVVATLQARYALAGYVLEPTLNESEHEVLLVSRWGLSKQIATLEEAEQFLQRVSVASQGHVQPRGTP